MKFTHYIRVAGGILLVLIIISIGSLLPSCRDSENNNEWELPKKELKSLEATIRNAATYGKRAEQKADSMKNLLRAKSLSKARRIRLMQHISDYYHPRMADSALKYAYMAYELTLSSGDKTNLNRAILSLTDALSASGYFSAAVMTYDTISIANSPLDEKVTYWSTGRQLYSNLCNYIGEGKGLYEIYQSKEDACCDSLIAALPIDKAFPNNKAFRIFLTAQKYMNNGRDILAREELLSILPSLPKGSQIYGMTTFQIAQTYRKFDQTQYAAYLAKAAESDILGGITDGFALPSLSDWLYRSGHYQEAFQYINFAMNDAYRGRARMRLVNISSMVPKIDDAYRTDINNSLSDFTVYALMVSISLIILIIILVLLLKEMRKRRLAHSQLASLSKLKDSYIRDFIGLCSAYSEKYDLLSKTVIRKITAGQTQDLLKLVKNGKASESENEEFYKTIDRVFISLYPEFIEQINKLLQPDQRYEIDKDSDTLNPELRIYGFVRLGVTESTKISKILNYSTNTVYAYRNRMRNKAINRDTFDEDVMNIDLENAENE
ncbi:MAG: hypothetical protein K2G23_06530 [Muribaculaceae bacterium]|nr:hypothetical protein [Muribaculaceae bacterium]